jgi:drug/metabolite transporter (DMT)-like permease
VFTRAGSTPVTRTKDRRGFPRRLFIFRGIFMNKTTKSTLAALLGYSIFGFSFLFSKTALGFASPFFLLAVRFLFAFIALNFVLLFGKTRLSLKGKPVGSLLLLGFIQPVCYFIFETYGIDSTSAAFSGVMIGTVPIIGLVLGILFLKEKCSFLQGFFTVLSVLGVYLTTSGGFGNVVAALSKYIIVSPDFLKVALFISAILKFRCILYGLRPKALLYAADRKAEFLCRSGSPLHISVRALPEL